MNLSQFLEDTPFVDNVSNLTSWPFAPLMDKFPSTKNFFIAGLPSYAERISENFPNLSDVLAKSQLVAYLDTSGQRVGICTEINGVIITFNPIWPRTLKSTRRAILPLEIADAFYTCFDGMGIAAYYPKSPSDLLMPLSLSSSWIGLDRLLIDASQQRKVKKSSLYDVMKLNGMNIDTTMCFLSTQNTRYNGQFEHLLIDTSRDDDNIWVWANFTPDEIKRVDDLISRLDKYLFNLFWSGGQPPLSLVFSNELSKK